MSFDSDLHDSFDMSQNDSESIDNVLDRVFRGENYTNEDFGSLTQDEVDAVFPEVEVE